MTPTEIIAQAFGIVAMVFNVLSYQGKKQSTVIAMQMCGSVLFVDGGTDALLRADDHPCPM